MLRFDSHYIFISQVLRHAFVMRRGSLLLLACLGACGLPNIKWQAISPDGPYGPGGKRAELMQKCGAPKVMVDARRCDYAFSTAAGLIDLTATLVPEINSYIAALPEHSSWRGPINFKTAR